MSYLSFSFVARVENWLETTQWTQQVPKFLSVSFCKRINSCDLFPVLIPAQLWKQINYRNLINILIFSHNFNGETERQNTFESPQYTCPRDRIQVKKKTTKFCYLQHINYNWCGASAQLNSFQVRNFCHVYFAKKTIFQKVAFLTNGRFCYPPVN